MWTRIDHVLNQFYYLENEDECYYAREYTANAGYQHSEANSDISNFQKPPERKKHPAEWRYKQLAVRKFADELSRLVPDGTTVMPMPTSLPLLDPSYDGRLEWVIRRLVQLNPTVRPEIPIDLDMPVDKAKSGYGSRDPNMIMSHYIWNGFQAHTPECVYIVDDVITTGSHFNACKTFIKQHCPDVAVVGVFWTKAVY